MNNQSKWRLDFAKQLHSKLRHFSEVHAILVGGSVARGYSDVYSDLELILYWAEYPCEDTRYSIINDLNAKFRYPKLDHGHESALLINGFPVDLWHRTIAEEEIMMNKVLHEYSLDLNANNTLDTIRNGIPLYGKDLMQKWKKDVTKYPEELSIRFLEEYLPHFHLRQLNFAVHRDNPTAIYAMISAIQSSLFLILLA